MAQYRTVFKKTIQFPFKTNNSLQTQKQYPKWSQKINRAQATLRHTSVFFPLSILNINGFVRHDPLYNGIHWLYGSKLFQIYRFEYWQEIEVYN